MYKVFGCFLKAGALNLGANIGPREFLLMWGLFASTKLDEQYSAYMEFPKTQSSHVKNWTTFQYCTVKETQVIQSNL